MSKAKKMTRKLTALSLSLIMVVMLGMSALPLWALAKEISKTPLDITDSFTCSNFLAAVRDITSVSEPNPIHASYVESISSLNVSNRGITSLNGIEHFTALTMLNAINNQLTSLNVSNNTALTVLGVNDNQLTSLDVSHNTALIGLNANANQLTNLDVSHNTALTGLNANFNQLTSLNVRENTNLTWLGVSGNQLASLDVSNNTALQYLGVEWNQLTSLDVSHNAALGQLHISDNRLTSLNVSTNPALWSLLVDGNQLTSLDVSNNPALTGLDISDNRLTSLNVSNNPDLWRLEVGGNRLTSLNVSNNPVLQWLDVRRNHFASVDMIIGVGNTPLPSVDTYDEGNFKAFLFSLQNIPTNGGTTTPPSVPDTTPPPNVPDTTPPPNVPGAIPENIIADALLEDNPFIRLDEGDSTVIGEDSLQAIRDSGSTLEIELPNGIVISIDPDSITDDARPLDLNLEVTITDTVTYVNDVQFPANSIVIAPAAHGAFGFTISFDLSAQILHEAGLSSDNVRLFHISAEGVVTEQGSVRRNNDGSVTISIDHASRWVLSETDLVLLTQVADPPTQVAHAAHGAPQTGVTSQIVLPIVLASLGLASIGGAEAYRRSTKKAAER